MFKVGDRVRFIEDDKWGYVRGQVYIVQTSRTGNIGVLISVGDGLLECFEHRFELADGSVKKRCKQRYEEVVF